MAVYEPLMLALALLALTPAVAPASPTVPAAPPVLLLEFARGGAQKLLVAPPPAGQQPEQPRAAAAAGDMPLVSLARGEAESFQVVMTSPQAPLRNLSWSVSLSGGGPRSDITMESFLVGFARSVKLPPWLSLTKVPAPAAEWYPVPLLPTASLASLVPGESVPIWVDLKAGRSAAAGGQGNVTVTVTGFAGDTPVTAKLAAQLRIFNFSIPLKQSLPNAWGNQEYPYTVANYGAHPTAGSSRPTGGGPPGYNSTGLQHALQLLGEHRISVNDIYRTQAAGPIADNPPPFNSNLGKGTLAWPSLSDAAALRSMRRATGTSWWNLASLSPRTNTSARMPFGEFLPRWLQMANTSLALAAAAGFTDAETSLYMFDETTDLPLLSTAASAAKAAFPTVNVMSTARDLSFGVNTSVDISVVHMDVYSAPANQPAIARARARGKQVWWYVSCCAYHPSGVALDFFIEYPALRSRLLGGAAPWKYKVQGFLYYQVAGWFCDKSNANADTRKNCYNGSFVDEQGGPRTAWKPYGAGGFPDGDGEILAPGIASPLATVQVKNWRDGSEDYEFLTLLQQRIEHAQATGAAVPASAVAAMGVPAAVLRNLTSFSDEPSALEEWRLRIAEEIEGLLLLDDG